MANSTYVGTSGLVLREPKKRFPEPFREFSRLRYYSTLFNSIEINSTFYKLHKPKTIERWSREVVDDFRFTFKLWREITHAKFLDYSKDGLTEFMSTLVIDPPKQGCILVQFPASIDYSFTEKVRVLLDQLQNYCNGTNWKVCVEFRHNSWYNDETFEMIDNHNATIVLHDMPRSRSLNISTQFKFAYLRFHGVDGKYRGSYELQELSENAQQIITWNCQGKDAYVYFNNTMGTAYENALSLRGMVNELTCSVKAN